MGFVTNGEHDQMMRDQQRDLRRIAEALEMANKLKWLELYASVHETENDVFAFIKALKSISDKCGWQIYVPNN